MASAARKAAEAFIAVGHVWDGPTCIRAVEIITSLLAEQPEAGAKEDDILIVDHGHRAFVTCGEEHAPAPSPARDEVREALREVADSGVEFNDERVGYVTVQIDRETWETVRRLAALSRDAKGGEK